MRVQLKDTCYVCNNVFCCATCLMKHFKKKHQLKKGVTRTKDSTECPVICSLCQGTPLALPQNLDNHILKHIENKHLPLNCKKCSKIYTTIEELKTFSKCNILVSHSDKENLTESKQNIISNMTHKTTISTQTSPIYNGSYVDKTPGSLIEQCWKSKVKEDYISDSVSSIKNLSSLSNVSLRRSIGVISTTTTSSKGKLVRTTSTPVHSELLMIKPKERTFDASSGQVSSICHSDYDSLADKGLAMLRANTTFSPKPRKIVGRPKVTAVTPLRHVMSKSIQKAFAEHGVRHTVRGPTGERQRLSYYVEDDASRGINSPLDLRLSPALRRSKFKKSTTQCFKNTPIIKSKFNYDFINEKTPANEEEVMISSQKVSRESIVITRTEHIQSRKSINGSNPSVVVTSAADDNMTDNASSVYTTCQSVEIIRSTKMSSYNVNKGTNGMMNIFHNKYDLMTPTCREQESTKLKKLINFETPKRSDILPHNTTFEETIPENQNLHASSKVEVFYTPESTPIADKQSPKSSSNTRNVGDRKKWTVRRQLTGHFSPKKRPPLRRTTSCYQPTVSPNDPTETKNAENDLPKKENIETWSLGSLMNSVMTLPSVLKTSAKNFLNYDGVKIGNTSNEPLSILKCAKSFAGQLSNAVKMNDMQTTLKRKRSNSIQEASPNFKAMTSPEMVSFNKKYRVQKRRAIH